MMSVRDGQMMGLLRWGKWDRQKCRENSKFCFYLNPQKGAPSVDKKIEIQSGQETRPRSQSKLSKL